MTSFLKIDQPDVRDYLLAPSPIFNHVRRDKIEKLLNDGCDGTCALPNSQSKFLFNFLNSKVFLEQFESGP